VFTKLRGASERILHRGEGDVATDDRILIPGRVIHIEQAGVGTDLDSKTDSLIAVGPPAPPEVVIDAGNRSVGSRERNRASPFKNWNRGGVELPESVTMVADIACVDVVEFVASQRDQVIGDDLGLGLN